MELGTLVDIGPDHIVFAPVPKGAELPKFSTHICCNQMPVWIKMPLGTEVGLGPGDFVLDGDPVPPKKGGRAPKLPAHVYCGQTATWIKMVLGTEVGLSPDFVLDGDRAPPPQKGAEPLPNFRPISIVAKRLGASRCHLVWR